jgi:NAD(P)H-flavin reductase
LSLSYYSNGEKFRNPYSIASPPNDKKFVEFSIKLSKNSDSSNFIKNLKKGDSVEFLGPSGKFTIDKNSEKKDLVFISVGTGITPLMSMISYLLKKGFKNKITLLKGFRDENEILYEKEFSQLQKKYKNFRFYNVLSRPKNKNFKCKGYVQNFLDKYILKNFQGDFYICGLNEMVESVTKKLKKKGINKNKIFFEKYN